MSARLSTNLKELLRAIAILGEEFSHPSYPQRLAWIDVDVTEGAEKGRLRIICKQHRLQDGIHRTEKDGDWYIYR